MFLNGEKIVYRHVKRENTNYINFQLTKFFNASYYFYNKMFG